MRWRGRQGSNNVDDRRGGRSGGKRVGKKTGLGIGGVLVVIIIALLGGDPSALMNTDIQTNQASTTNTTINDDLGQFSSVVLKETEDVWNQIFAKQLNAKYREPTLVLFSQYDESACGTAKATTGPFYCPADEDIYIDLTFFEQLRTRYGASGDFAAAYVIAHEVGHHIQKQLGATKYVHQQRGRIPKAEYNQLSVRLELQADFYAGVWAHYADKWKGILEEGDIQEALGAANAIGDDRLQERARGYAVPESFTHGTSEQRMRWFLRGYQTGDIRQGDTFNAQPL